ncbi:hypothetical protein BH10ACT11_BH10ACT11_06870 [soil metagenome]
MEARHTHRGRLLVAGLIAVIGALAIVLIAGSPPSEADPGTELLPDLVTLKPPDVRMPPHPKRDLLRLSNEIGNRGTGPLELFPSPVLDDCDGDGDNADDRTATQRVFNDSDDAGSPGYFDRNADNQSTTRPAGCMVFHPQHNHWHFDDFSRYQLYRESTGNLVASNQKVSFCVVDSDLPFNPASVGQPSRPYFPTADGCDATATEGLSVGWADIYGYYLPGQQLDLSDRKGGTFCLVSTADPDDQIAESNEANNSYRMRVRVKPRSRTVQQIKGGCKLPARPTD